MTAPAGRRAPIVNTAPFGELPPEVLYGILRLRAEVFVVEQRCVFCDPDGRDTEPTALHCWIDDDGGKVVACLRVLERRGGGSEIGRVVTDRRARRAGLAGVLLRHALGFAARPVHLNAQSPLERWYASFGFVRSGAEFLEDGIAHVPMVAT